jgi:hypothetical protein
VKTWTLIPAVEEARSFEGDFHMKLYDFPRRTRRKVEKIVASMESEDRNAWDEMITEDEDILIGCLMKEMEMMGGVWDLEGIKKHFRIARLFYLAATGYKDLH